SSQEYAYIDVDIN
nr:Chain A, Periplasmic domain of RsgI2 [Acetivibrio thermocellus DSM 1313]8HDJ_C Chain C, Periplasmic domain of RsgI2 [Acetivibrio thermocellus DSM 1313]8HDJ_E Chain E, Periplasmic domain of RsgI2 [Acetivibrio thermocellus DSM 1313]8HDJ_G Chain G, Periplasmic domain of RsgI2 [Acetivibrio thermocellus DSM 1313]